MQRFTISLEDPLARAFDALIVERGYASRSEAVRDLLREALEGHRQQHDAAQECVASLTYVFNHHQRELGDRLTRLQHAHHDLVVSSLHLHLDHDNCLETLLLRGPAGAVRGFADHLTAERGVHHGQLKLIGVQRHQPHRHDGTTPHVHIKPTT